MFVFANQNVLITLVILPIGSYSKQRIISNYCYLCDVPPEVKVIQFQ